MYKYFILTGFSCIKNAYYDMSVLYIALYSVWEITGESITLKLDIIRQTLASLYLRLTECTVRFNGLHII